jgi:hypothetical protein
LVLRGWYVVGDDVRVTVDIVEFERFRRDHGAQCVPLTTRRINLDAHCAPPDLSQ